MRYFPESRAEVLEALREILPLGFYRNTIQRFAEAGGRRLADCADPCAGVELTPEECAWALQGNPPPAHCRMEVEALQRRWIVTVEIDAVRVTPAETQSFDPGI